jgi:hypothetical protein
MRSLKSVTINFILFVIIITFQSFNQALTIQSYIKNQPTTQQEVLFQPTILYFESGSNMLDSKALSMIENFVAETKNKSNLSKVVSGYRS